MTFGATSRADMQELLADLQGGPVVDAYGTSCFQAAHRNGDAMGAGPVATALKNGVEMSVVIKPDFMDAAMRRNSRLKPALKPTMQNRVNPPAMRGPSPLGL